MAVSKRIRFEVLRRDNHTCQYCGAKAPDVELQIDHVMPVSLGGDDKPGNLVTACKPCNAGKTSITPESPLVQGLSDRAAAYALGMQDKMTRFRADVESIEDYVYLFHEAWDRWKLKSSGEPLPLPSDYRMLLFKWKQMGVPTDVFDLVIPVAQEKYNRTPSLAEETVFRYMAGVLHNMLEQREIDLTVTDETAAVYTEKDMNDISQDEWCRGMENGMKRARQLAEAIDPLRNHIDQSEPEMRTFNGVSSPTGKVIWRGSRAREYSQ